jgi:hypothetical protein
VSAFDIHPEELLDKRARAVLSPAERVRLDSHLAACDVCRFELALRGDLEQDLLAAGARGAARDPSRPELDSSDAGSTRISRIRSRPAKLRRWSTAAGAAAALFVLAAASLASYAARGAWPWVEVTRATSAAPAATNAERAPSKKTKSSARAAPPPRSVETPPEPVPSVPALPHAPAPEPAAPAPGSSSVAHPVSPAALFSAANTARRAGDVARALELYRRLAARFPTTEEAITSHVIVGRLLLGIDSAGALSEFEAYLTTRAPTLAAEASVGRARALAALGRHDESHGAWQEVITRFPRSVYADEARKTLGLAGPP